MRLGVVPRRFIFGTAGKSFLFCGQVHCAMEGNRTGRGVFMASKKLGVNNRKAIFLKLVELQDSGITVRDSKNQIQESFGIEDDELQAIEDEGLDNQWPPLGVAEVTKLAKAR